MNGFETIWCFYNFYECVLKAIAEAKSLMTSRLVGRKMILTMVILMLSVHVINFRTCAVSTCLLQISLDVD
jgi:hypothetical protein